MINLNNFQGEIGFNFSENKCIIKETGEEFPMNNLISYLKSIGQYRETDEIVDVWTKNDNGTYEKKSQMRHVSKFELK